MACITNVIFLSLVLYICKDLKIPYPSKGMQLGTAAPRRVIITNEKMEDNNDREMLLSPVPENNVSSTVPKLDSHISMVNQTKTNLITKHHWESERIAGAAYKANGPSSTQPERKGQGNSGLLYGFCPGMCQCDLSKSGYWRHIPRLPGNCTQLSIETGYITTLETNSFSLYPNLTRLSLVKVNMKKIQSGAFAGLPSLQFLSLDINNLNSLPTLAFQNTPVLSIVSLKTNDFNEIPHDSICLVKHLTVYCSQPTSLPTWHSLLAIWISLILVL